MGDHSDRLLKVCLVLVNLKLRSNKSLQSLGFWKSFMHLHYDHPVNGSIGCLCVYNTGKACSGIWLQSLSHQKPWELSIAHEYLSCELRHTFPNLIFRSEKERILTTGFLGELNEMIQ